VLQNRVLLTKMWLFVSLFRILKQPPLQVRMEIVLVILTHATQMVVLFVNTSKIMNCNSNFNANVVWSLKIEIKVIALYQTKILLLKTLIGKLECGSVTIAIPMTDTISRPNKNVVSVTTTVCSILYWIRLST
jgi:hypothetical protein